ncbi:MAG: hypothetical protein E7334_08640 [Clostridiales bacterium]|nr:hypothetical protein [Clostridiales bacterium]
MKALKIWGVILLIASLTLFLIGFIGGEFNKTGGLYGTSTQAILLSSFSLLCLILSFTVAFIVHAINEKGK